MSEMYTIYTAQNLLIYSISARGEKERRCEKNPGTPLRNAYRARDEIKESVTCGMRESRERRREGRKEKRVKCVRVRAKQVRVAVGEVGKGAQGREEGRGRSVRLEESLT